MQLTVFQNTKYYFKQLDLIYYMISKIITKDNDETNYIIEQVLPDYIKMNIPTRPALCAVIPKKETGKMLNLLKQKGYFLEKVHLNNSIFITKEKKEYQKSQSTQNKDAFELVDCSFLKRVKNGGDINNIIIITFLDEIQYLKKNIPTILSELNILEENTIQVNIPSMQPISQTQYEEAKKFWSITSFISPKEKFIYEHKDEEQKEIISIFTKLKQDKEATCILYDPQTHQILSKGRKQTDSYINHEIMDLLYNYSKKLSAIANKERTIGQKEETPPIENTIELFGYNEQYYCEGLYVFTIEEPCIMCSMALVHNRINRIYYEKENKNDGGLVSQIEINNYKLNHHYHIFKITNN